MNKFMCTGRLTKDPEIRYSQGENSIAIASFSLAVDRRGAKDGQPTADFINCKAFGKLAEHLEKYWHKGMKMVLVSHVQTGSYTNKDGVKVYTTDFVAEEIEFGESKSSNDSNNNTQANEAWSNIPEGLDEELPFAQPTR